jgi:hypothetical protein
MSRPKDKYAYTIEDIAKLTKQTANAVRQHMTRGKFNPAELSSVVEYVNSFNKLKTLAAPYERRGYMSFIENEALKREEAECPKIP